MGKKVAVIGSGCSGIAAFWALRGTDHDVFLFEADGRLGGHTNTVQWRSGKYAVDVDTGFIVLNTATYPNFINFLKTLKIATEATSMALSVSRDNGRFEWGGNDLASVFCQTSNFFSLRFWRMLFDVVRFNQFALDVMNNEDDQNSPIGEYLDRHGYSHVFRDWFLIPITAAVWSTNPHRCIDEFPTLTLIRFLWNHGYLSTISAWPEWLTLRQGSKSYIDAVMEEVPSDRVFLNIPVHRLENDSSGRVRLIFDGGRSETFDHVILATHGDQALSILGSSAIEEERSILSAFKTSKNEVVLHSDLAHMPKRRGAWCSWNYMTKSSKERALSDTVSVTYNMNILQHIPEETFGPVLVTLNPLQSPDPRLTQGRFQFSHPLYTPEVVTAQERLYRIQNKRGISYAGAWTKYGFHEDGFSSGLRVARDHLDAKLPFELVEPDSRTGVRPEFGMLDRLLRMIVLFIQLVVVMPLGNIVYIRQRLVKRVNKGAERI